MIEDQPKKCLPFSPNWYCPQILNRWENLIAYGSNSDIFVLDIVTKEFYQNLYNDINKNKNLDYRVFAVQFIPTKNNKENDD